MKFYYSWYNPSMPYKDKVVAREKAREINRRRSNSLVTLPPITRERILEETIDHGEFVEAPLHNYKYELIGYTKIDKDIWEQKYKGERLNLSNYGYARYKSDFVHYRVIGKPTDRWTFIDHINRDRLDNRRQNLRFVSPKENCENSANTLGGTGISGEKDICFVKGRNRSPWRYTRFPNGRECGAKKLTNYFPTLKEAIEFKRNNP